MVQAAQVGLVCIATSGSPTGCPSSVPSISNLPQNQNLTVGVSIQNSDPMHAFDIYVKVDTASLNPVKAVLGPLIKSPAFTVICINGVIVSGSCAGAGNGPGVVEVSTIESNAANECFGQSVCSGLAFNITYNVVSSSQGTPVFYPHSAGCVPSSVGTTDTCVLVTDALGRKIPENTRIAMYDVFSQLLAVILGNDGTLYWTLAESGSFVDNWQSLSGSGSGPPALCSSGPGMVEVVVAGADHQLWHRSFVSGAWSAWDSGGGGLFGQPACGVLNNVLHVVVRGGENIVWTNQMNLTTRVWAGWIPLTNVSMFMDTTPVLSVSTNRLDLVMTAYVSSINCEVYLHMAFPGGTPTNNWDVIRGAVGETGCVYDIGPAAIADNDSLHLVAGAASADPSFLSEELYYNSMNFSTGLWSGWEYLKGSSNFAPALALDSSGNLHIVVKGDDGGIYHNVKPAGGQPGTTWDKASGGCTNNVPAIGFAGSTLVVLVEGCDNGLYYNTLSGSTWSMWASTEGATTTPPTISGV